MTMQWPRVSPTRIRPILTALLLALAAFPRPCRAQAGERLDLAGSAAPDRVIERSGVTGGLIVHLGTGEPEAFAARSAGLRTGAQFIVHALYRGEASMRTIRDAIGRGTEYGPVSAEPWTSDDLPYVSNSVNLIVAVDLSTLQAAEIQRVLAPGGVAMVRRDGHWSRFTKPRPAGIDDWPHLLYDASNNAVSRDRVVGPPQFLQWVAPPVNARHHESLGTVTVAVSAGGRLFTIIDRAPAASILLPAEWFLAARDAFNGILLWERSISTWENHLRGFRSGPPELSRTLVAARDRVYVTLAQRGPVSVLDASTGETIAEFAETMGTEEILLADGVLYLALAGGSDETSPKRSIMAVDADHGNSLWRRDDLGPLPMSLAVAGDMVACMSPDAVVCLDAATGRDRWRTPRDVAAKRPGWSAPTVVISDGVVLVADRWTRFENAIDEVTGKPVAGWLAREGWTGDLVAYAAADGGRLWDCRCAEAYHSPPDVFVVDGLVWVGQSRSRTGPDFVAGRDLHTGEVKRELDTSRAWETTMPHHRCHRNRATERYIIAGRTGVEFIDLATGDARRHHWTRGTCQFGTLPANGLLYAPPHACACYIEAKLTGYLALAPGPAGAGLELTARENPPTVHGPAFGKVISPDPVDPASEWPTYRHDGARSAYLPSPLPSTLGSVWERDLGRSLTSPVVAAGRVFVADTDRHTLHALDADTGNTVWTYTANARIDSPPTISGGCAFFGCADGVVRCLRAGDGAPVWRFQAAPLDRRLMAFGQLESAWPVHGTVLVHNNSVYVVAGRSSYLDGGLVLYRLEAASGQLQARRRIYSRDPETGEQPDEPIMFEMPGALPDILSTTGGLIYMRHLAFDPRSLESVEPGRHLFSPAGFLNGDWWHRTYWIHGTHFYCGYIGWFFAGHETPAGRLLAFTDDMIYGYGYTPTYYRGSRERRYHLFALDRTSQSPQPPPDYRRANRDYPHGGGGKFTVSYDWSQDIDALARALVLSPDTLFAAGPPEQALTRPAVFKGQEGARLTAVSTTDGHILREYALQSLPVYDGMAAAYGRIYLALQDGRLLCLGADGTSSPAFTAVVPLEERLPPLELAPEPGLRGYWKLDEGEGDLARDSSGNAHTGKVTENWTSGPFGTCLQTNGIPAVLTLPDGPYLHTGTGPFAVDLWISLQGHDCRILGKEAFPRTWWVINVLPDGRTEMVLGIGTGTNEQVRATSKTPMQLNAWTHLVYVVDRANDAVHCYVNGRLDRSTAIPPALKQATFDVQGTDLRIPSAHKPYRGLLDEVRFYGRTLSDAEIQAHYGAERERRTNTDTQ